MRTWAALLLLAAFARAKSTEVQQIEWALLHNTLLGLEGTVNRLRDSPEGKDPGIALRACRAASDHGFAIGWSKRNGSSIVSAFEHYADAIAEAQPDSAEAVAAQAETRLLHGRALRSEFDLLGQFGRRRFESAPSYAAAADLFVRAHEIDAGDGMALARAVLSRTEGAWLDLKGRDPHTTATWMQQLDEQHPGSAAAALARAMLEYSSARLLLDPEVSSGGSATKDAKEALESAASRLRPYADDEDSDIEFATLYNAVVELALANRRKLHLDLEFVTYVFNARPLGTQLPRSRLIGWSRDSDSQHFGGITQWSLDGRAYRHHEFSQYRWNTEYTIGPRGIGGDNPKGLIQDQYDSDSGIFERRVRNRRITKGRLNRHIATGYWYEIVGTDAFDQMWGFRCYCFKGEVNGVTIQVWSEEIGHEPDLDPIGEFIRDSMRER